MQYLQRLLGEARTRILLCYTTLTVGFVVVALPLMQQRIFSKVNDRVREDLQEEVRSFKEVLKGDLTDTDRMTIKRTLDDRRPPFTTRPKTKRETETIFEVYFGSQIPEDDTYLLAIVDGEFYKSSPRALPEILQSDRPLMQRWQSLTKPSQDEQEVTDSNLGSILYIAEPIEVDGKVMGMLVVAHATEGERREAIEALSGVVQVLSILLIVVLGLAWWLSGNVLAPLRSLSATAHQISETDLTARIVVEGNGEIAEVAKTFNEMMDRLASAFETQRNFINDAGHELRTPITIIQGHLELMGDDPIDRSETVALVLDELDRMSRMVDELVLLAKAERPDFLQLEEVYIPTLTEELLLKAKALGDRTWQLDRVALGKIRVDRQRITEAVINLAQNAVQHTEIGTVISIGSSIDGKNLRLWVRDMGSGVALEDQPRIFERFARAARSRRKSEGSGLGLAITKAIVEAHHGEILLSSQPGNGAVFTIVIPMNK